MEIVRITDEERKVVEPELLALAEPIHRQLRPDLPADYSTRMRQIFAAGGEMCVAVTDEAVIGVAHLARLHTLEFRVVFPVRRGDDDQFRLGEAEHHPLDRIQPVEIDMFDHLDERRRVEALDPPVAIGERALCQSDPRAVAFAQEHDLLLLHDAAYSEITFDGYVAPSALQVPGAKEATLEFGSASKFSWEALAFLDWRFGETTSFVLGYRAVGLDRQKGEARADVILHGPLLGLLFRY